MIEKLTRKTKIVWSVEYAKIKNKILENINNENVQVIRLIVKIDELPGLGECLEKIKRIKDVPILVDVCEQKQAQVSNDFSPREFQYGQVISVGDSNKSCDLRINAARFETLFKKDAHVYVGYGNIVLRVLDVKSQHVEAKVIHGGIVHPGDDISIPATRVELDSPFFNEIKINALLEFDIDYLALPVFFSQEISKLQRDLKNSDDRCPWIIAKIDSRKTFQNIDEILETVDGVMICRQELSLMYNPATIPMISKEIIQKSLSKAKLVLMASEMLFSMRCNPTPTRAEVSDIANATIDGSDAVVLSEEASMGKFASKVLDLCSSILEDVETDEHLALNWYRMPIKMASELDVVTFHAYNTAKRLNAKAIVCITKYGNTALRLASYRADVPIIAVTFSKKICKKLSLVRGVNSMLLQVDPQLDDVLPSVNEILKRKSWLRKNDLIVFVSVSLSSMGKNSSNLFSVQRLE